MNRRTLLLLAPLLWSLAVSNASAQTDTCSNYLVPLVVRNPQGELMHNFSPGDFELKFNGKVLPITSIHKETRPRRIVILLDASGSMRADSTLLPWRQALDSAELLAKLSEGRAHLALLVFNEKILEEIGFSTDNSRVKERLEELQKDSDFAQSQVHGQTRLYDSMNRAFQLLVQPTSADAIYLASDGEDTRSRTKVDRIQKNLADFGVRVFAGLPLHFTASRHKMPEPPYALQDISEIVGSSGGDFMQIAPRGIKLSFETRDNLTVLEGARLFFAGMLENEVVQAVIAPPTPQKRRLSIRPANTFRKTECTYPRELYVCSLQPI